MAHNCLCPSAVCCRTVLVSAQAVQLDTSPCWMPTVSRCVAVPSQLGHGSLGFRCCWELGPSGVISDDLTLWITVRHSLDTLQTRRLVELNQSQRGAYLMKLNLVDMHQDFGGLGHSLLPRSVSRNRLRYNETCCPLFYSFSRPPYKASSIRKRLLRCCVFASVG